MIKKKFGFTVVELMIAIAVSAVLGLTVYKFVSAANKTSAIARCKGNLRLNAQMAARQLERDIASSKAIIHKENGKIYYKKSISGNTLPFNMLCPKEDATEDVSFFDLKEDNVENPDKDVEDKLYETIEYSKSGDKLMRKGKKIASNIKDVNFRSDNSIDGIETTYDGKVEFSVTAAGKPDGQPDEIEYVETVIVAIRQLQNKMLKPEDDKHWKQRVGKNDY